LTTLTLTTTEKGKHAELLAQTALLANGYTVLEPIAPESFDLAVRNPTTRETLYVQVKTAYLRDSDEDIRRYGGAYLVVRGAPTSGKPYPPEDVDSFIAVWQGRVFMFPNEGLREYWVKASEVSDKWTEIFYEI